MPRPLFMSGGSDNCSGTGSGVRTAFTYNNIPLSNLAGIFDQLAIFTYQDTVTSTGAGGKAYIADNTTSPYQGQQGMEHEFNSTDSGGARSDALYAYEGWMNSISSRTDITLLNAWVVVQLRRRIYCWRASALAISSTSYSMAMKATILPRAAWSTRQRPLVMDPQPKASTSTSRSGTSFSQRSSPAKKVSI